MMPRPWLSESELTIFLFHGVVDASPFELRNYTQKHVLKDAFEAFLTGLQSEGQAVSMEEVIDHHRRQRPYPKRAFAITFDDGFANNLEVAAPLLCRLGIPATFYLTTDFIDRNALSWTDRLEIFFEDCPSGEVALPGSNKMRTFGSRHDKIQVLNELRTLLKSDPLLDVDAYVAHLFRKAGREEPASGQSAVDRKLSWDQVRELSRMPGLTIGGHSHEHKILSFLPEDELEYQIRTCVDKLRKETGTSVRHFSYPEGLAHCYSARVIQGLQRHGIECCPTARPGTVRPADGLFELNRVTVIF